MFAKNYYHTILEPNFLRFREHPNDDDLPFALAVLIEHIVDQIKLDTGRSLTEIRSSIKKRYPDFDYLRVVAISTKHGKADSIPGLEGHANEIVVVRTGSKQIMTKGGGQIMLVGGGRMMPAGGRMLRTVGQKTKNFKFVDGREISVNTLLEQSFKAITEELNSISK